MKILVINCGSSSLKYQLIDMETEEVLASGKYERIGEEEAFITHKVNGQKISSPFEIKAIGSQALFSGSLTMPGGYLEIMENDGVLVDIEYLDEVTIEKYDGVISYKYVHNND